MTEENTTNENQNPIRDEFEALGKNIQDALNAAWESDKRKNVQTKIEESLREIGDSLDAFITNIQTSEKGQQVRAEVEDLGERIRNGEVADKAREGLVETLKKINAELTKAYAPKNTETEEDASPEA